VYNEAQLGAFLSTVPRDSFTVGTKYAPWEYQMKADYETVKTALVASLHRLQLSYVDIYYTHRVPSREYAVEFAASVQQLQREGLVRGLGFSEIPAEWLRAAHQKQPVCCIQQEWSLLTRGVEEQLVPVCRELGIGIVAYSPLARNLLAAPKDRPSDARRAALPRFEEANFSRNVRMMSQVEALAAQKQVSAAQLSLAWLLHKSRDLGIQCLPIPGTKTLSHALDNIASTRIQLAAEDMVLLEQIAALTSGHRESDKYMEFGLEGNTKRSNL